MSTKRNYRRLTIKDVSLETLVTRADSKCETGATVGLDVAKHEIVAVVRWSDGTFDVICQETCGGGLLGRFATDDSLVA